MLHNRKRVYGSFTVEKKARGWFYRSTYADDTWRALLVGD
jgi:hypothetical protein